MVGRLVSFLVSLAFPGPACDETGHFLRVFVVPGFSPGCHVFGVHIDAGLSFILASLAASLLQ